MDWWEQIKISVGSNNTFDNYCNTQIEVNELRNRLNILPDYPIIVSGKSGSGITHLLHAITNNHSKKNVLFTNAQWIIHLIKKAGPNNRLTDFQDYILSFDIIVIDNLQFFYKRSTQYSLFIINILKECERIKKPVVLGCSKPDCDLTRSRKNTKTLVFKRIELKPLSGDCVFKVLKEMCIYEVSIPDKLLFVISDYNGTVQDYINCLISIRFRSKIENINLFSLSIEDLDQKFKIKDYFPKQQFRKCTTQYRLNLWEEFQENIISKQVINLTCEIP